MWFTSRYPSILARVAAAVPNSWPKQLGEEGFMSLTLPYHSSLSQEVRAGTWRQELMQRPWRGLLTGLLLRTCSACFLTEPPAQEWPHQQWAGTSHINYGGVVTDQSNKWRHLLNWGSFFQNGYSLCQDDKTSHTPAIRDVQEGRSWAQGQPVLYETRP